MYGSSELNSLCLHRDDLVDLYIEALQNSSFNGTYNATAPNPVRMSELCSSLGRVIGRPSWLPVPEFALQVFALSLLFAFSLVHVVVVSKIAPSGLPSLCPLAFHPVPYLPFGWLPSVSRPCICFWLVAGCAVRATAERTERCEAQCILLLWMDRLCYSRTVITYAIHACKCDVRSGTWSIGKCSKAVKLS